MSLGSGWFHNCLAVDGQVTCWGHNGAGQLGDGGDIYVPPDCGNSCGVDILPAPDTYGPYLVAGIDDVIKVDGGWYNTCALTAGGAVYCWGFNDGGILGDGTTTWSSSPVAVTGLASGVVDISTGYSISCAVTDDGRLLCWGGTDVGGGLGTGGDGSATPVEVTQISGRATAVSVGNSEACVLIEGGSLDCWEPYGDGTPKTLTELGNDVAQVSAGEYQTCVAMKDGTARCWGETNGGVLGNGTEDTSATPVKVTGLDNVVSLASGTDHTCAVLEDGGVSCWGFNQDGDLGDGTTDDALVPVEVVGIDNAVSLSAGEDHTCALLSDGTVKCWGSNAFGVIAPDNGALDSSAEPVVVNLGAP